MRNLCSGAATSRNKFTTSAKTTGSLTEHSRAYRASCNLWRPRPSETMGDESHLPRGVTKTGAENKEGWFVGSIDQGTTSTRFLIFNGSGDPVASHQMGFDNKHAHSG